MNLKDWLPKFKRPTISLPRDSGFWAAVGQVVAAVAAVIMVFLGYSQLRMAYQEAKEQRAEAEAKREYDEQVFKAMSTPFLGVDRKYRGIEVEYFEDLEIQQPKRRDPNDPVSRTVVRNYGTGPALNVRAEWHTMQTNWLSHGGPSIKELRINECTVEPKNIMPGQDAEVIGWPDCFKDWHKPEPNKVVTAQGYIVFKCERMDGTEEEFKETFDMSQGFAAKPHPLLKTNYYGKKFPWEPKLPAFPALEEDFQPAAPPAVGQTTFTYQELCALLLRLDADFNRAASLNQDALKTLVRAGLFFPKITLTDDKPAVDWSEGDLTELGEAVCMKLKAGDDASEIRALANR